MEEKRQSLESCYVDELKFYRQRRSVGPRRRRVSKLKDIFVKSVEIIVETSPGFLFPSNDEPEYRMSRCNNAPGEASISNTAGIEQADADLLGRNAFADTINGGSMCLSGDQDALKQEVNIKDFTNSSELQLGSDKCDISSSSRTNNEHIDETRVKRKHKPKVHFDDIKKPDKSVRKVRRMKIMRYLGLAAPVGSPYTIPRSRNTC